MMYIGIYFCRETLLGQLQEHVRGLKSDFQSRSTFAKGEGPPKGINMPEVINHVVWARQLQAKVSGTGNCQLLNHHVEINMVMEKVITP